ncbi:MAG: DUF1653 domain-containing protein [Ruminococcus sp.]
MGYINESIIYNIYPLGFCGAPRDNDGKLVYRLDKIYDCIEHLKKMSVNALVFNPLFESSRHGYDTIDYRKVDCRLGDNDSFKKICNTLHENGIKVILDGVFNHVGRDFFAFKDVQQNLENSRYCNWFQNLNFGGRSPKGDLFWYEGWAGYYELVKLNLQNDEVVNYLLDSVKFWIDEFDIDGLRLDAADCIVLEFFKKLRNVCKSEKPDFWLYGEITHGDYNRWANDNLLDSVTNYECYKGIYSSHNDHNYFEIAHSLNRQFGNGGIYRNIYTYNFVDNHDVNRIASDLKDKNHLENVYTLMYTMPGVPSIYYGSEYGIEGKRTQDSDYELRPCLDLNNVENANYDLLNHIIKLGKVRLSLDALKYGKFDNINIMNEKLVYKRFTDNQTVFVAFNLTDHDEKISFDAGCNAKLTDVLNDNEVIDVNGYCELSLKPYSSRILVVNDGSFKVDFNDKCEVKTVTDDVLTKKEKKVEKLKKVQRGRYRHFKGAEYEVLGVSTHSETGEKLVIYMSVDGKETLWARPYDMFTDVVEHNGKKINRFTLLS